MNIIKHSSVCFNNINTEKNRAKLFRLSLEISPEL